jgi:hypothetical protein
VGKEENKCGCTADDFRSCGVGVWGDDGDD